jgi:hypothetical protein
MMNSERLFDWIMQGILMCLWFNLCIWIWALSEWFTELIDDRRHPERERRKRRQRELAKLAGMESRIHRMPRNPGVFPTTPETEELKGEHDL